MRSRRSNPHRMLQAVTALLTVALLGVLAAQASASASSASVFAVGTTTTRAASDSAARAKAKATATTTKGTAAKPATTKPAATTNAGTPASASSETRTTLTRPTVATTTSKPGAPSTTPARPTAQTTTTTSRPPTVARIAPAPAGTPAGKTGAPATVARVAPSKPAANAAANTDAKTAPVRPGTNVAKVAAGAATATAVTTPSSNAPAKGSVKPIAASGPAKAVGSGGSTVSKAAAPKPSGRKATGALAVAVPLDEHVTYQYNALGRRDVFQSLMDGEFVGVDVGGNAPPDVGGVKLVGIVWGSDDQFAMVEDARGDSYVLRRGDKVMNGFVEGLKRDAMIVNMTVDGQSQSITIPVTRKGGEKSNANR